MGGNCGQAGSEATPLVYYLWISTIVDLQIAGELDTIVDVNLLPWRKLPCCSVCKPAFAKEDEFFWKIFCCMMVTQVLIES